MSAKLALPAAKRWKHPGALPLSEVEVGGYYDGTVTNSGAFGVFVDIGAVKDGLVRMPIKIGRYLRRGTEVPGLRVVSVDLKAEHVLLEAEEEALLEAELAAARSRGAGRSRSATASSASRTKLLPSASGPASGGSRARRRAGAVTRSASEPRRLGLGALPGRSKLTDADRIPHEELQSGTIVDGLVRNTGPFGVFLDIGAAGDARLHVKPRIGRRLKRGDIIRDCHVDWVDVGLRRIQVSVQDPDGVIGISEDKLSSARAVVPPRAPGRALPLEAFKEDSIVDGYVRNVGRFGIFIDIGCVKDARLDIPRKLAQKFKKGDEMVGMRVDKVDLENGWITVSIDDPKLAIEPAEATPAPRPRSAPSAKAKASGKAKAKAKPTPAASPSRGLSGPQALASARGAIERFAEGDFIDGFVKRVSPSGVFVDIGVEREALLDIPRALAREFQMGDEVHGMRVESVGGGRMVLSLEDPRLDVDGADAAVPRAGANGAATPSQPRPSRSGAGAAKAPAQAPARPQAGATQGTPPRSAFTGGAKGLALESLVVGAEVTGKVTRLQRDGVFLDIGAICEGWLSCSREDARKFELGDQVEGVIIESVTLKRGGGEVLLTLPYELGDTPYQDTPCEDTSWWGTRWA
mmetsp:Transcript_21786/g.48797  ORF Transcript_21786/g.48797 Transcript_21786/m.48797 type:complete len:635 (-) Transcript_21786:78-1982(-)